MRAWELNGGFDFDNLKVVERPDPMPGPGEVRVRLHAATLNYRDPLIVSGVYNPRQKLPLIPVSDGCGVVDALGEGVADFAIGDRVMPLFNQVWMGGPPTLARLTQTLGSPLDGVMADYRVFRADGLVKPPRHLSNVQVASLPCAGVTAWTSLVSEGELTADQTVVIQGTGGVSMFALLFAHAVGAETIVTSSSDAKLARAKALGADHLINYRTTPEWSKAVREVTAGRGADHIVEVGGAGTLDQSLRAIAIGGTISIIGVLAGAATQMSLTRILMQHVKMQGITVGNRDDFEAMARVIERHHLEPVVDREFAFEELPQAMRQMAEGGHFGKIALSF